jgi:hypothetical protein
MKMARGWLLSIPTKSQPHSMNKIEDYGLKAVTLIEDKQILITAVSALHADKAVV